MAARSCWIPNNIIESEFGTSGYIWSVDGLNYSQYTVNLRDKNFERREQSKTIIKASNRGEVGMVCFGDKQLDKKRTIPSVLLGGRSVTRLVELGYYDNEPEQMRFFPFLDIPLGPYDLIEQAVDLEQG